MRRKIGIALGAVIVAYALLCVMGRLAYPRMLFPAPRVDTVPAAMRDELAKADGPKLLELAEAAGGPTRALVWRAPAGARTVVVFHGNGETMFDEAETAEAIARRGLGAMLVEYRGYGLTYGPPPSEAAMYDDAEAALLWLAADGSGPDRVVLWGFSLGTGVAAEMAKRGRGARLVLVAPYTSIVDMGRRMAPFLPVSLLLAHRFDTIDKAPAIRIPTLVIHGDADEVVPFEMGERVARAIPNARLIRVPGGHHMDVLTGPNAFDAAVEHAKSP